MTAAAGPQARAADFFSLRPPSAAALNHLLRSASWARARLQPFAGRIVRFELAPFTAAFTIRDTGEVADTSADAVADASFALTPGIALSMLSGDANAWQKVAVSGDGALVREVLFIAQNLRWDVEEDLSRVFGDIIAHRMVAAASELRSWQRDTARNFGQGFAAYWTDEQPLIASRHDVERFVREVDTLRDDVARFEKRLDQWLQRGDEPR